MKFLRLALLSLILSAVLTACGGGLPTVTNGDEKEKTPEPPAVESQEPTIPAGDQGPDEESDPPGAEAPVIPAPEDPKPETGGDITANYEDATLLAPGESFQFLPVGVSGTYAATYISKDSSVATVDGDTGKVTAVGVGKTTVSMHFEE